MRVLLLACALLAVSARAEDEEPQTSEHETAAEAPAAAAPAAGSAGLRSSAPDAKPGAASGSAPSSGGGAAASAGTSSGTGAKAVPKGCEVRPAYKRCGSSVVNCPKYVQEPGVPVAYKVPASFFDVGPNDAARLVVHTNGGGKLLVSATNSPCAFTCGGPHDAALQVLPANTKKDAHWRKTHPTCVLGKGDVYVNVLFTTPCPLKGGCSYMIWQ